MGFVLKKNWSIEVRNLYQVEWTKCVLDYTLTFWWLSLSTNSPSQTWTSSPTSKQKWGYYFGLSESDHTFDCFRLSIGNEATSSAPKSTATRAITSRASSSSPRRNTHFPQASYANGGRVSTAFMWRRRCQLGWNRLASIYLFLFSSYVIEIIIWVQVD